ncbi:hypothetical protein DT87_26975 [Streptomyces sp. NTK 937]|nr:hypothetical protein DT87_26975 [Streptomyces sp. NTK 937]
MRSRSPCSLHLTPRTSPGRPRGSREPRHRAARGGDSGCRARPGNPSGVRRRPAAPSRTASPSRTAPYGPVRPRTAWAQDDARGTDGWTPEAD